MITVKRYLALIIVVGLLCLSACSSEGDEPSNSQEDTPLSSLPEDSGGTQDPFILGSTSAEFGYYLYTPGGYSSNTMNYPLVVFLHGQGERGNGTASIDQLKKVLNTGLPKVIKDNKWHPSHPMLVVSPQFHAAVVTGAWGDKDPENLKGFIKYMIDHYRVNPKRIYLTGLSHGGNGVYDYITTVDDSATYIAAAAPIAAYGLNNGFKKSNDTPFWTFVGGNDGPSGGNFSSSINFVTKYNAQVPAPKYQAKFTGYIGVGHDCWTMTYDGTGMTNGKVDPDYDPFDESLADWMLQYKRED